jgi:putative ABC transport system permease protein
MAAATSVGALARIARRDALHHRTRSLLLLAMIALPVAGLVASGALLDTLHHRSISHLFLQFEPELRWQFRMLYATTLVAAVLLAGAAVTIAARRQLRALGLLAAAGARGRHLGAVVILQAATLGLAGVLVGVPAGLLLARGVLPLVAAAIRVDTGPLLVVPGRLLLAGVLGLLVAVAAAMAPAVGAARLPVTAALAARRPPPQQRRWLLIAGLLVVLAALGLVALQARWMWLRQPWNRLAVLVGLAALSPALVALRGRSARRLPATLRLAVRDLAGHPTRSAAAVAAITVGLAVPMILGVEAAQWVAYTRAYAPRQFRSDQVLTYSPAATAAVTQRLPGARQARFTTADDAGREVTVHGPAIDQDNMGASRGLAIGDQQLLVAMGGEQAAAAFAGGAVVAFGSGLVPDGQVTLAITDLPRPARRIRVPAVEVTTGAYTGEALPSFVISRQAAAKLALPGLATSPRYLIRAPRPLSAAQHDQLRRLQGRFADIAWEPTDLAQEIAQDLRTIILALLGAAAIIALGSVAAACALALTEARQDLTTLAQLGAHRGMTRRLAAAEAWLLAGLGALLAVAAGLAPAAVTTLATANIRPSLPITPAPIPFAVPWTLLAVVILAIPALAGAGVSLLGRSPAPRPPRPGF